jgi:hypothetical protein
MSARLGDRSVDFPVILERSFTGSNTTTDAPIPVIFLYKASASLRAEVMERMKHRSIQSSRSTFAKREIIAIPWLRGFTPSIHEVSVFDNECIIVDENMLAKDQCIISHLILVPGASQDTDTYEYATVDVADAYQLMCSHLTPDSWFPRALDPGCKFEPTSPPDAGAEDGSAGSRSDAEDEPDTDLPVFLVASCTSEQQHRLAELLSCDYTQAELIYIASPDAEGQRAHTVGHVMRYFLSRSWFPSDFVVVDATTLSSAYFTSHSKKKRSLPSFLYGTALTMWHAGSQSDAIASDAVGYAVNRIQMQHEDDYAMWLGATIKALGLSHWVEGQDAWEKHYWACWKDAAGTVDPELNAEYVSD